MFSSCDRNSRVVLQGEAVNSKLPGSWREGDSGGKSQMQRSKRHGLSTQGCSFSVSTGRQHRASLPLPWSHVLGNWPSVHTTSESPLSWLVISHDIGKPCAPGLLTSHICPTTGIDFAPPGSSQSLGPTNGHSWELLHIHNIHLVPSPLPQDCQVPSAAVFHRPQ